MGILPYFFSMHTKVTEGLKWPPVNGAPSTNTKNSENTIKKLANTPSSPGFFISALSATKTPYAKMEVPMNSKKMTLKVMKCLSTKRLKR
jgi:hypothetical protein